MTGRCRIISREYLRWCFVADTGKNILPVQNVYPDPLFNTKAGCSAGECLGDQKDLIEKKSIKDSPPATQGREEYMVSRLDQAAREMERMFGEDR